MAKKEICEHDWQPTGKFSKYKPNSGTVHTPVRCSKCGVEHTLIDDVLSRRKKAIKKHKDGRTEAEKHELEKAHEEAESPSFWMFRRE